MHTRRPVTASGTDRWGLCRRHGHATGRPTSAGKRPPERGAKTTRREDDAKTSSRPQTTPSWVRGRRGAGVGWGKASCRTQSDPCPQNIAPATRVACSHEPALAGRDSAFEAAGRPEPRRPEAAPRPGPASVPSRPRLCPHGHLWAFPAARRRPRTHFNCRGPVPASPGAETVHSGKGEWGARSGAGGGQGQGARPGDPGAPDLSAPDRDARA